MKYVLAIDAGTTGVTCLMLGEDGRVAGRGYREVPQYFPAPGLVEHDAVEILDCVRASAHEAIAAVGSDPVAIGITNQRETIVVWERATGTPVYHALVWQDRRTAQRCAELAPRHEWIGARTGLVLDPYFSATKLEWLLREQRLLERYRPSDLACGTIDTWLVWKLTGGKVHATDPTNASRTMLYDIDAKSWSDELCALFNVPRTMLPEVRDSAADYGAATADVLGAPVVIRALVGDQQAGAVGQECTSAGEAKATYGTGCFVLVHTGNTPVASHHRLLTTTALQLDGVATYALEGSIFNAGTVVQWLRDKLGLISTAAESEAVAQSVASSNGVYVVPAFTGLGAPWWNPDARGMISGLTRDSGRAEIVRAALESVALQTRDLAGAFADDGVPIATLRVDGGMAANDWLMQTVADQLRCMVERPVVLETTAWGAARLAGMQAGVYPPLGVPGLRQVERTFTPAGDAGAGDRLYEGWRREVGRASRM